jgi:putative PIN family toxin of toxin-antitoxin system
LTCLVLDANTLLSGIVGLPGKSPSTVLVDAMLVGRFEAVISETVIEEVRRGCQKPYFKARLSDKDASAALARIRRAATVLADSPDPVAILRDSKDDYLIALARTAGANAIVTGDKDLLDHAGLLPQAITARRACDLLGLTQTGPIRE